MSRVWCCIRCGRWGTRSFTFAPNDDKARVCANDRACARRAAQGSADPVQCPKCGGPHPFHDPACVVHPDIIQDHNEQEQK